MTDADLGATMGFSWNAARHRRFTVSKVENGWKVKAKFLREEGENEFHDRSIEKEFVFYTEEECLDFCRQYMAATKEDLEA